MVLLILGKRNELSFFLGRYIRQSNKDQTSSVFTLDLYLYFTYWFSCLFFNQSECKHLNWPIAVFRAFIQNTWLYITPIISGTNKYLAYNNYQQQQKQKKMSILIHKNFISAHFINNKVITTKNQGFRFGPLLLCDIDIFILGRHLYFWGDQGYLWL